MLMADPAMILRGILELADGRLCWSDNVPA